MQNIIEQLIAENKISAASFYHEKNGEVLTEIYKGQTVFQSDIDDYSVTPEAVTKHTLFDTQSITKILSTIPAYLVLLDQKVLKATDLVKKFIPEFAVNGKDHITIFDLAAHSSGLPSAVQLANGLPKNQNDFFQTMYEEALDYPTGKSIRYSDLAYRILGRVLEIAAGQNLEEFTQEMIWQKVGMNDTYFLVPEDKKQYAAATGFSNAIGDFMQGDVADAIDFYLGGITGADGVFTSTADMVKFCKMMLGRGSYQGQTIISEDLINQCFTIMPPYQLEVPGHQVNDAFSFLRHGKKTMGWEITADMYSFFGKGFSDQAIGKVGAAGTFVVVDPLDDSIVIFFTNYGLPYPFTPSAFNEMTETLTSKLQF